MYVIMCVFLIKKIRGRGEVEGWVGEGKHLQDEEDPYL